MAKRDRTQMALDRLAAAVEDPHSEAAAAALSKALAARSSLVVAAALAVIHEHELTGFEQAMHAAFANAMVDPVRSDPGCRIKLGVVKALDVLREPADELCLAGIRHVQREPVWGGSQDTAAGLRGQCAMALVNRGHPDAMLELGRLLGDPEREARVAAAHAVAASGDAHAGVPLLILRVRTNESDPEVLGACSSALLGLDDGRAREFVVEQLEARDPLLVEAAALALGQARQASALAPLIELAERSIGDLRRVAMLAIALLRNDDAWAYLLERIAEAPPAIARDAIEALAVYREFGDLQQRVALAVAAREADHAQLERALGQLFSS